MNKEELQKVLQLHKLWFQNDPKGTKANLREADLRYANLWRANLREADLRYANLWRANLREADLRGANLREADLRYANLSGANLSGVDLSEADLSGVDLSGVDLRYANLSGVDLWRANLREADLRYANLSGVDLRYANLSGVDLSGADLRGVDLSEADLSGVDLSGANLSGANVKNVKWPSPTMVLLAHWGECSDELTRDLMLFDAMNHPEPWKFDEWAAGGDCPYSECKWERCARFREKISLWPGVETLKNTVCSPLELAERLIKEHCKEEDSVNK